MSFLCILVCSDVLLGFVLFCSEVYSIVLVHFSKFLLLACHCARNEPKRLLTEALNNLAQLMANQEGDGGVVAYQGLDCFQRNDPPTFKGGL